MEINKKEMKGAGEVMGEVMGGGEFDEPRM
jgi:hypothetical protein